MLSCRCLPHPTFEMPMSEGSVPAGRTMLLPRAPLASSVCCPRCTSMPMLLVFFRSANELHASSCTQQTSQHVTRWSRPPAEDTHVSLQREPPHPLQQQLALAPYRCIQGTLTGTSYGRSGITLQRAVNVLGMSGSKQLQHKYKMQPKALPALMSGRCVPLAQTRLTWRGEAEDVA